MQYKNTIDQIINSLNKEHINTWFDLGLFIDRLKESRKVPASSFNGNFKEYEKELNNGGLGFVTFHISVDGVSVEMGKYASIFKSMFPDIQIHYLSGIFKNEAFDFIPDYVHKFLIPEIQGFDDWKLYKKFYFTSLERGSKEYNSLIIEFWNEVVFLVEKIGNYVVVNNIHLLYLVNICSNPGNVSLSLAITLLSELLGIPVINNNHDFYWESGSRKGFLSNDAKDKGPRDFFFTNAHLGEFFSIIEVLFPWESRNWINVNINRAQTDHLININGINPANVMDLGTAVDTNIYKNISKRKKINAFIQFEKILSRYKDKLVAYSVEDVINNQLVDENNTKPILIGGKTTFIDKFLAENIIFLQPTRIISRKRIEVGFRLLLKILEDKNFKEKILKTKNLKITILVTGPIAAGHYDYFQKLLDRFKNLLTVIDPIIREKIFLAFIFSELDKERFKRRFENPVGIPELYNIASLILLPSKTEGRGLPIIEATACGTPIFCRRYIPENVYSEVIGEHLSEKERLRVIEYDGKTISSKDVKFIIDRILFPHKYTEEISHNRKAVINRYSLQSLSKNIQDIIYRLYYQSGSNDSAMKKVISALQSYRQVNNFRDKNLDAILHTENRQYMAGYGKLAFMIYLKSLIDPSFFRIEEQEIRGRAFDFAMDILKKDNDFDFISSERKFEFFNIIENIFLYKKGEIDIRHDHSMAYRHRNKNYYPYQDYTLQELTGLINMLYFDVFQPTIFNRVDETPHFFTDWDLALLQLTGSAYLAIDNRKKLIQKLQENIPIAYFPGEYLMHELELFVLQSVRSRLGLKLEEELDREILEKHKDQLAEIFVFTQEKNLGRQLNMEETKEYILSGRNEELELIYEYNILRLVPTKQWTVGIHFVQLGSKALEVLKLIKDHKGFLISNRRNAVLMTDIIDIDCFHVGKVRSNLTAAFMGIPMDSGYIQFIPAGIRTCISFPTPTQTSKDFDKVLKSKLFKKLVAEIGEDKLFAEIKKDAEINGSPIQFVLDNLNHRNEKEEPSDLSYKYISGVYDDQNSYNGVMANIQISEAKEEWDFAVLSSDKGTKKVTAFVRDYERKIKQKAPLAWNGGYILNPELVGKLGIPESYIGSPLGLIISNKKILCPPLFNKAALLIFDDGHFEIKRVNSTQGLEFIIHSKSFFSGDNNYNNPDYEGDFSYFDLMYDINNIEAKGRTFVRLAGNIVKDIIHTKEDENVALFPVGLNLSFKKEVFPEKLKIGDSIDFVIQEFKKVKHAIEAGPMLLENRNICLDMQVEGWKTKNSIKTQAARLDYTDMRGPKIAAGIDKNGNLSVLAINGRIRESVGASHINMAEILQKAGMVAAMGFDPGGSSTLVINGEEKNISPYNSAYEENIYSMPPEPRAVSNAIIAYKKKN